MHGGTYKELYEGRSLWLGLQEELISFALRQDPFLIDDDIIDINAQIRWNMPHFMDHTKVDIGSEYGIVPRCQWQCAVPKALETILSLRR